MIDAIESTRIGLRRTIGTSESRNRTVPSASFAVATALACAVLLAVQTIFFSSILTVGGWNSNIVSEPCATAMTLAAVNNVKTQTDGNPKYAYAFLYYVPENGDGRQTEDGCEVFVALEALKRARGGEGPGEGREGGANVDFVVMELESGGSVMTDDVKLRIEEFGAKVRRIKEPESKGSAKEPWTTRYIQSFAKLRAAELFEYRRVVFLELDYLPLQNPDHLFSAFGDTVRVPYAAPRMYWDSKKSFSQAGPFVTDPDPVLWKRHFARVLDEGKSDGKFAGDNDWTNKEFSGQEPMLPGFMALLVGEWIPGDGVHGFWGRTYGKNAEEIYRDAPGVHFVAGHKPWSDVNLATPKEKHTQLWGVYERWWSMRDEVCQSKVKPP